MHTSNWLAAVAIVAMGTNASGSPIVLPPGPSLAVQANSHPGGMSVHATTPVFGLSATVSATDTDSASGRVATASATYDFSLVGSVATFSIAADDSYTTGGLQAWTHGSINFAVQQPTTYSISGHFSGSHTDSGDEFSQSTSLSTSAVGLPIFMEDEGANGLLANLILNQSDDTGGGGYIQAGPLTGLLPAGSYRFDYAFRLRDLDSDAQGSASGTGAVVLTLVVPEPRSGVLAALGLAALIVPACAGAQNKRRTGELLASPSGCQLTRIARSFLFAGQRGADLTHRR